jgi:invasion protein IalB
MRHFHALKIGKNTDLRRICGMFCAFKLWPDSRATRCPQRSTAFRRAAVPPAANSSHPRKLQEQCVQSTRSADGQPASSADFLCPASLQLRNALLAALAFLALLCGAPPSPALAQEGTVKAQYGDWQIVCKPPPAGAKNEICALVQSVTAEDKNNIGLTVYFQKFSNGTRVLRVFAPLGILLPPGLGLKIDDKDVGHAPFLRCHSFACYAQVVVEDPLIEQLKNGKTAIFIIFQTEEAGIGIPISLNGFKEALEKLK